MEDAKGNNGYGKRPLWQWIVIYLIIGTVVYGLVYYFVIAKKGGYNSTYNQQYQYPTSQITSPTPTSDNITPTVSPTAATNSNAAPTDNIYKTTSADPAKGSYLTDFQGMTLYTFDKDTTGVSNCYGACASTWPSYSSGATAQSQLPTNITVITRTDGSKQFAWKGMPLYYYASDKKAGDVMGDGIGGVWHLVKP